MKKFFQRLMGLLNINGREVPVFVLAILAAFSIWLIHNLSLRYNDFLSLPVRARCEIEGHSAVSSDISNVTARGRTTGFNIIRFKMSKHAVDVHFSKLNPLDSDPEVFYLTASELQEYTPQIFGDDVILEYYVADTLFFRFPFETYRKVPVNFVHEMDFAPQYTLAEDASVDPDSIFVYGQPDRLERISYVYTEPVRLSGLDSDVHGMARLKKMRDVRFSADAVNYSIAVTRYVEIQRTEDVVVENLTPNRNLMVFPPTVKVRYRCPFPYRENYLRDVKVYVDYNDFRASRSGACIVKVAGLPQDVISWTAEPSVIECVLADR